MIIKKKVSIIGLGYVGLPLATEFAKKYKVVGYDINIMRIAELKKGIDRTKEFISILFSALISVCACGLFFSCRLENITAIILLEARGGCCLNPTRS